ncbi:hypothetical protein LTR65_000896 [Meristemomyces frigidus]
MPLFTPPSSTRKSKPLEHHEDLYGYRNPDEEFDRYPDSCEDETNSDEEKAGPHSSGFFEKYSGQIRKKLSPEMRATQLGSTINNDNNNDNNNNGHHKLGYQINPKINSRQSIRALPSKKLIPKKGGLFSAHRPKPTSTAYMAENITPTKNGTSGTYPTPTSNIQQRNDMYANAFMSGGLGNLGNGFDTLEYGNSSAGDPFANGPLSFGSSGAGSLFRNHAQDMMDPVPFKSQGIAKSIEGQSGSFEDQTDDIQNQGANDFWRGGPKRQTKAAMEVGSSFNSKAPAAIEEDDGYHADEEGLNQETVDSQPRRLGGLKPATTIAKERADTKEPSKARYTTRGEQKREMEREEAERLAKRPRTRSTATGKASWKSEVTARSATLHKKAKKKVAKNTASKEAVMRKHTAPKKLIGAIGSAVSKRHLVRGTRTTYAEGAGQKWKGDGLNWMGEEMNLKPRQLFVVVPKGEVVDVDGYDS